MRKYYDSDLSIWLSVDPLMHKYAHSSPYVYCNNNPIMLIDPNGEFDTRAEARQYKREHDTGGRVKKDKELGGFMIQNKKEGLAYKKMPEVAKEGVETIGLEEDGVLKMPLITAKKKSLYVNFVANHAEKSIGNDRTMPFDVPTINIDDFPFHNIWHYMKWWLTIANDRSRKNAVEPTPSVSEMPSPAEKVKNSVPNPEEYIEVKHTYSDGSGRSSVGRMVRRRDSVETMNEFKRVYGN